MNTRLNFSLIAIILFYLSVPPNAMAAKRTVYGELLDNCTNAILGKHPASEMALVKKTQVSGGKYKFWIDINGSNNQKLKAYCEGKMRGGKIKNIAIGEGTWRNDRLISETNTLLEDNS
ncbi:hypothetical protein [Aurantivibrio infirmus]